MKTTVSVIKADIGSVSGHCVSHPALMEKCEKLEKRRKNTKQQGKKRKFIKLFFQKVLTMHLQGDIIIV